MISFTIFSLYIIYGMHIFIFMYKYVYTHICVCVFLYARVVALPLLFISPQVLNTPTKTYQSDYFPEYNATASTAAATTSSALPLNTTN